jgi:hypothetical protein
MVFTVFGLLGLEILFFTSAKLGNWTIPWPYSSYFFGGVGEVFRFFLLRLRRAFFRVGLVMPWYL